MIETGNCWDTVVNDIVGEDEFENVLNFLDFPMGEIEETEIGLLADWDIGNPHCLGPIPQDVPIVPPKISSVTQQNLDIVDPPEQTKPSIHIEDPISQALKRNKVVEIQEPVFLQTQSPVSVLESNVSSSNLPTNSTSAIPVRPRSKRARRARVNPWVLTSSFFAPKQMKDRQRRKKPAKESSEKSEVQYSSSSRTKKCTHCEVTKTPQWREGPLGPKTLCNACGVRYRSGRLFPEYRPAASPTFTPSLHSNSHKKVIEMRYKGKLPTNIIEEPPISPQPEFVPNPMGSSYLIDYIK